MTAAAKSCTCFALTGEHERDNFTVDAHKASALALLGTALAPAETPRCLAIGALQELSRELSLLHSVDFNEVEAEELKWAIHAMSERARVAVEVIQRMQEHEPAARMTYEQWITAQGGKPVPLDQRITRTGGRVRKPQRKGGRRGRR